ALRMRKNRTPPPPAPCPLTECMALLGGAWTPNVIWYLSDGPRRFNELRVDIPPISAKVLSTRLHELEDQGVITRRLLATSPPSAESGVRELGGDFLRAIRALLNWGMKLKQRRG